ncbi:MAG: ATP-dependent Clp protease proteolytic subunit [Candidatus Thorarchaeota archaeon]
MSVQDKIGLDIIKEVQNLRNSKVIVYFTGDRRPYFRAQIGEDAVRPLYDHLLNLEFENQDKRIDLFIYSLGGDVSVPWRIVSMIREFCDEFNVLIPYRAHSGATLISIGADNIIMGKKAELGPIDPTLERILDRNSPPERIAVEDVNSFLTFIKDKAEITDQNARSQILKSLVDDIGPRILGNVGRMDNHIRLVAKKLLTSRSVQLADEKIGPIVDVLTTEMYFHGHAIGRREAKDIGLPIIYPDYDLEEKIWNLYLIYEKFLKLDDPVFPEILLKNKESEELTSVPIALIESDKKLHVHRLDFEIKKKKKIPANPSFNFNLQLQLPSNILPQQITQQSQQILNQLLGQINQQIPTIISRELQKQSPVIGYEWKIYNNKWYNLK